MLETPNARGSLVGSALITDTQVHFWTRNSTRVIRVSVPMPAPRSPDSRTSAVSSETGSMSLPTFFCFLNTVLAILGPLHFHMDFRINFQFLQNKTKQNKNKKNRWDFDRDYIESTDQRGSINILIILSRLLQGVSRQRSRKMLYYKTIRTKLECHYPLLPQ